MSSEDFDLAQEPRKVFVNFLIFNMKQIEDQLFFGGRTSLAVQGLRGLISSLDQKSQSKLQKQLKTLLEWDGGKSYYKADVETVYREVSSYLHGTYLKEAFFAKPRYSGRGKLGDRNDGEE